MTRLIIPYNILIMSFGLVTTFLLLASSHHVDKDFLVVNTSSLVVFPSTAYFLFKNANSWTKTNGLTILLLSLTAIIFSYYTYDFFKYASDITWFSFVPLTALILTLIFLASTVQKRQTIPKEKAITNWDEYWKLFDNLCSSLNLDNKQFIVTELKDAQQHVNGLTDGWHEFLNKFEKVNNAYKKNFSQEQYNLAQTLIQNLKSSLCNR
jgi:hypothetical protein